MGFFIIYFRVVIADLITFTMSFFFFLKIVYYVLGSIKFAL